MPVYGRPLGGADSGSGLYGPGEGIKQPKPSKPPAPPPAPTAPPPPTPTPPPIITESAWHLPGHAIETTAQMWLSLYARAFPTLNPLTYEVQQITADGRLSVSRGALIPDSTGVFSRVDIRTLDGWLVSVAIGLTDPDVSATPTRVRATLAITGSLDMPVTQLLDSPLYELQAACWPHSISSPLQHHAPIIHAFFADPAPGAEIVIDIPQGVNLRMLYFHGTLATSATVATRATQLWVGRASGTSEPLSYDTIEQTASLSRDYNWRPGGPLTPGGDANVNALFAGPAPWLEPGDQLGTVMTGRQAADQWTFVYGQFEVEILPRWRSDPPPD